MSAHLGKIALMVMLTHGFRTLGRISNPRLAALALGLPCSTVVALVGSGFDRGLEYSVAMTATSLVGLAGAVVMPTAYAWATVQGWRPHRTALVGVATFLTVAISASSLLPSRGDASLGLASVALIGAIWAASRIPAIREEPISRESRTSVSSCLLRTILPIACFRGSLAIGDAFGPEMGGLMSTFPGVTLTVLLLTHLESGPASAVRMARALPVGNLGTLGFIACFRYACPVVGLQWGALLGYLAALACLTLALSLGPLVAWAQTQSRAWPSWCGRFVELDRVGGGSGSSQRCWPRAGRRFSPLIERLAA